MRVGGGDVWRDRVEWLLRHRVCAAAGAALAPPLQMAGRAGRRGLDTVGTVVLACWEADLPDEVREWQAWRWRRWWEGIWQYPELSWWQWTPVANHHHCCCKPPPTAPTAAGGHQAHADGGGDAPGEPVPPHLLHDPQPAACGGPQGGCWGAVAGTG